MSFRKVAPLAKPAPKHEVHKKAAPAKPATKKTHKKDRPRPIGD
ncbi:hypothetical protein [Actinacidiphila soli]|jgi:hypothetical protein|nr:hypothetical protein [Actinacidiphila soli]